jgi:hypothetical protein
VVDPQTLAFPSYDGNGMFKSLGNVLVNPHVGILFIDFESPKRLRVNGRATVHEQDPLISEFTGAQLVVRVHADAIFPNCPRYIHKMQITEQSAYVPCEGHTPPVPRKQFEFRDVLPRGILPHRQKVSGHPAGNRCRIRPSSGVVAENDRFRQ